MRVLITGANGFVGTIALPAGAGSLRGQVIDSLLLLDTDLQGVPQDPRLRRHCGSITDAA
jgi:nucleoside-diphosphate-sugar epimerase